MKQSVQKRIVSSILIVGVASVLLGLSLVYFVGTATLTTVIGSNFKELADVTSQKLDELINHHVGEAVFVAGMDTVVEAAANGRAEDGARVADNAASVALRSFLAMSASQLDRDAYELAVITNARGQVVAATRKPPRMTYGDAPWWKEAYANGQGRLFLSDVVFDQDLDKYTFMIATPIHRGGDVVGVLSMVHDARAFFQWVTQIKVGKTDHTMLIASDGTLLFCPVFPIKTHTLHPDLITAVVAGTHGWGTTTHDVHYPGSKAINGFAPVKMSLSPGANFGGKTWYIFTSQDPRETYKPVYTLLTWIIGSGATALGLVIVLGFIAARRIVRPIKILQAGAQAIGNGNLQHRITVDTDDEIVELADGINMMAEKLATSYAKLEHMVEERTLALAQRTNELERRNEELFLLYSIASSLNKARSLDDVLGQLLGKVLGGMAAHAVFIGLIDTEGEVSLHGRPHAAAAQDTMVHLAESVVRDVLARGRLIIVPDTTHDAEYRTFEHHVKSFVGIPLRSKEKTIGAMVLLYVRPYAPGAEEHTFFASIGHQAGVVVENARLFALLKNLANS